MQAIGRLGGDNLYGTFFTADDGIKIGAVLITSVIMWLLTLLVNRGVESASFINAVVMVAKLVPLAVFLIIAIVMFKAGVFTADFWSVLVRNSKDAITGVTKGTGLVWKDAWGQIQGCFMVLIWVYVGIEGATVFTGRAQKKSEAAKATIIGFVGLSILYVLISMLPYGLIPYQKLADLGSPALGEILRVKVGTWGMYLMNIGLAISVLGSWLSWTLLPVETTTIMAERKLLPSVFGKTNAKGSPTFSLVLTTALCQLFIITLLFPSLQVGGLSAYDFAYYLCASAILVSWMFIGFYAAKLAFQKSKIALALVGAVAGLFQIAMMYLTGWQYTIICLIAYLPGIALFFTARNKAAKETGEKAVSTIDVASAVVVGLAAVAVIVMLATKVIVLE
jgi:arginine:ornithine antiporter/lysine permease